MIFYIYLSMEQRHYIVYLFTFPDGKYYVGQTSTPLKRRLHYHEADRKRNRSFQLYQAINLFGWDSIKVSVLFEEDCTKIEVDKQEIQFIEQFDSFNNGYNMTLGGGGSNGHAVSKETREKISKKMSGKNNPMYGKTHSQEVRDIISRTHKGKKAPEGLIDKLVEINSVPVQCFDMEMNFIKEYPSAVVASKEVNIYRSSINKVCRFREKSAGGYIWRYPPK